MDNNSQILSGSIADCRHFPIRQAVIKRRRETNHIVRSTAKRMADWDENKQAAIAKVARFDPIKGASRFRVPVAHHISSVEQSSRRFRVEQDIRQLISARGDTEFVSRRRRAIGRPAHIAADEAVEGQELARSDDPLPSDRFRLFRAPSLEREDAFRVESTAKAKISLCRAVPAAATDDAQVAELYAMGLLYDNDRDNRERGFDLNSIRHRDPIYTVRVARRGRRGGKGAADDADPPLQLDSSFPGLGNHKAIAQYLRGDKAAKQVSCVSAPLRVVYDLNGRQPSFDVETSQPPDLINDAFSDYECLSDSELDDDIPSQREVRDPASNLPCDTWVVLG